MRFWTLVVVGFLACSQPCWAQDTPAERKALAVQFVSLFGSDELMNSMVNAIWPTTEAELRKGNPAVSDETLASLKQILANSTKATVSELVGLEAEVYAEEFTVSELNDILEFYQSPAGAKLQTVRPKLLAKIMPTFTREMKDLQLRVVDTLRQAAHEKGLKL